MFDLRHQLLLELNNAKCISPRSFVVYFRVPVGKEVSTRSEYSLHVGAETSINFLFQVCDNAISFIYSPRFSSGNEINVVKIVQMK